MAIRDDLNAAPNTLIADLMRRTKLGELLALLIDNSTSTETGLSPSSNVITLAATPTAVFQVKATAGTVTGTKTLRIGKISGEDAITPATGECVWQPGTATVLFAAVDGVTTAAALYAKTTNKASALQGLITSDGGAGI